MSILVFAESQEGNFKKSSYEAVSYASQIALKENAQCIAVSIGNVVENKLSELSKYGANKIISVAHIKLDVFAPETFSKVISDIAIQESSNIIVISSTYSGKSIAPRVAAKLKAGIVTGVISMPLDGSAFKVKRTVYSGKAFAEIEITTDIKVIAITPNSFDLIENDKPAEIQKIDATISDSDIKTESIEINTVKGKIPLTEAELVVSGGRGMKGPENWHMIEDLANILGAATACSKPVADVDWRPHSEHVGQTGITIKPNLYIAVGISGAIQHLAGVNSSKVIVVINKDPEAPFFKAADYGIVGDAFEIMPKIIEAAKGFKSQNS